MKPTTKFYLIHCQTNLHAGSGDSNYGIIDKLVQRDPSDGLPCINASSLKGAFREYFEEYLESKNLADELFGASEDRNAKGRDNNRGSHIIHDALLLSRPVRSNLRPYYMATAPMVLEKLARYIKLYMPKSYRPDVLAEINQILALNISQPTVLHNPQNSLRIEGYEIAQSQFNNNLNLPFLTTLLGEPLVIFPDTDFSELCDDYNLPIVARNCLENGRSTNLWYEQIIPRETRFFFPTNFYDFHGKQGEDHLYKELNNQVVQIGGNSSVGYGYCSISNFIESPVETAVI